MKWIHKEVAVDSDGLYEVTINPWRLQRMTFYSLSNIRVTHCLFTDKCHYIHLLIMYE